MHCLFAEAVHFFCASPVLNFQYVYEMKTGFLLPRSTVYPLIAFDFLDGFKSFAKSKGWATDIKTDNIGFGIDEKEVYSKTEAMLLNEGADVVVLFAGGRYFEILAPLFTATGKLLLLVNMGDFLPEALSSPATVIEHTFNVAFNAGLTGKLAAKESKAPGAVVCTSYYDGGYLNVFAMVNRFLAEGGTVAHNYISHFEEKNYSIGQVEEYLAGNPDSNNLLCIYSADVAPFIYNSFSLLQQQYKNNLYVSPMMLDESLKAKLKNDFCINDTKGFTAWLPALHNEGNRLFTEQFTHTTGKAPGIFSLLGWESGLLVKEMEMLMAQGHRNLDIIEAIKEREFESPRGWMKLDKETQQTYSPSLLASVSGNFDIQCEEIWNDIEAERLSFNRSKPAGATSGWRNTYLCS
jgi:branched-chain amino acid transport system substrate-binding protein